MISFDYFYDDGSIIWTYWDDELPDVDAGCGPTKEQAESDFEHNKAEWLKGDRE